jgi:hypothetical protein
MEDRLRFIFNNVNEWLKFAEQKNAAIIVFNTAIVLGILGSLKDIKPDNHLVKFFLVVILVTNLASVLFALLSFVPILKRRDSHGAGISGNDNLIFYMDIAKYCVDDYYNAITTRYNLQSNEIDVNYHRHLISQITNNSKIAKRKYFYFRWAGRITMLGFVILIITYLSIKIF